MSRFLSSAAQRWILALGLVLACSSANAAFTSAVSASTALGTLPNYSLPNLYNGTGLSGSSFAATHSNVFADMWLSNNQTPPGNIVFDLGSVQSIAQIAIWNYNYAGFAEGPDRGVQQFSVDVSLDGIGYIPARGASTLAKATGTSSEPVQLFALSNAGQARYVRLNIISNYGDSGYVGLSEVHFDASPAPIVQAAVPTLTGWGLLALSLLVGSAALGFMRRRREPF